MACSASSEPPPLPHLPWMTLKQIPDLVIIHRGKNVDRELCEVNPVPLALHFHSSLLLGSALCSPPPKPTAHDERGVWWGEACTVTPPVCVYLWCIKWSHFLLLGSWHLTISISSTNTQKSYRSVWLLQYLLSAYYLDSFMYVPKSCVDRWITKLLGLTYQTG